MRIGTSWTAAAVAALVVGGAAFGQPAAPIPGTSGPGGPPAPAKEPAALEKMTLEELLAKAMKDNPDVRVAEAKLREADAVLNRTRQTVVQKIVVLQRGLEAQRALVQSAEAEYKRAAALSTRAGISAAELDAAQLKLIQAKAKLAEMEAELPYLIGNPGKHAGVVQGVAFSPDGKLLATTDPDGTVRMWDAVSGKAVLGSSVPPVAGTMAEGIRKALDTPITTNYSQGTPLAEILEHLSDRYAVPFRLLPLKKGETYKLDEDLKLGAGKEKVPLGAALQALEDTFPDLRFVVREYGIVAGRADQLPQGALRLHDFWKGTDGPMKPKAEPGGAGDKNPAPEGLAGAVKAVDDKAGVVALSVGSDAGLQKGHTLEVFRLNPPKYLGTLRVLDVKPTESVAKPVGRTLGEVQAGDRVASRLVGN